MTAFGEILRPEHVVLSLGAKAKKEAIDEVLSKLNGDKAVQDFEAFSKAVHERNAPAISENGVGICIAHGRTDAISSLVLAVGRSPEGFRCPEVKDPIRLVFVAGITGAFNAEYLRIVGVIARVCRDRSQLTRLLAAKTGEEFVQLLHTGELKL